MSARLCDSQLQELSIQQAAMTPRNIREGSREESELEPEFGRDFPGDENSVWPMYSRCSVNFCCTFLDIFEQGYTNGHEKNGCPVMSFCKTHFPTSF